MVNGVVSNKTTDFAPDASRGVIVRLRHCNLTNRAAEYKATVEGNVVSFEDRGQLRIGIYNIEVLCYDSQGTPYRYMARKVIEVVDATSDAAIAKGTEFDTSDYMLDGAVFFSAGNGCVQSDWAEEDEGSPAFIKNKPQTISTDAADWISRQMRADLEEEAKGKFAVTTTPDGNSSYYADEVSSKQMTVKVYTTFGGDPVDCGQVGDWQHTAGTNEYTKVITASGGSGATCAAQTFTYTVPSGGYAGITVTGESEKRSISAVRPFYYGWVPYDKKASDTTNVLKTLTRSTSSTGSKDNWQEPVTETSRFWIVTMRDRTASATQAGGVNILKDAEERVALSPKNSNVTLFCKVYISNLTFAEGANAKINWEIK